MGEGILYNIDSVSSQTISGGHIVTTYTATADSDVINKEYFDDNIQSASLKGNLAGNLSGNSYTYGIIDIDFVSSQAISGGSYNIPMTADQIIYRDRDIYYCRSGRNGSILATNNDASTLFNSVLSPYIYTYVASGIYNISSTINIKNHSTLYGAGVATQFHLAQGEYDAFYISGDRSGDHSESRRTRNVNIGNFSVYIPPPSTHWYSGNIVIFEAKTAESDWYERRSIVNTLAEKITFRCVDGTDFEGHIQSGATAIKYSATGNRCNLHYNFCRDMDINGVGRGIHIYTCTGNANNLAWINTTHFENITIRNPITAIEFDSNWSRNPTAGSKVGTTLNNIVFNDVEVQCGSNIIDGIKNITDGNRFFNVNVTDFGNPGHTNARYAFSIISGAQKNVFIPGSSWMNTEYYYDSGSYNIILGGSKTWLPYGADIEDYFQITGSAADYRIGVNSSGWLYVRDLCQTNTYPFLIRDPAANYSMIIDASQNDKASIILNADGLSTTKEFQNIDVRNYQLFVSGDSWSHKIRCYGLSSQGISGGSIQTNLISSQTGIYADWVSGNATNLVPGAGLSNVVEDTTPQLGGDLDANDKPIYDSTGISSAAFSGGTIYGHHRYIVQTKTANYSALVGEYVLASNTITIKLPDSHNSGDNITVKNIGTGTVTVSGQSGDTIDGDVDYDMQFQYESVTVISDGTNWYII